MLVLLKLNPKSSIISSLMISLIFNYLNGLTLSSIPGKCNPNYNSELSQKNFILKSLFHILTNVILAFISIYWSSVTSIQSHKIVNSADEINDTVDNNKLEYSDTNKQQEIKISSFNNGIDENEQDQDKIYVVTKTFLGFHVLMILFAFYVSKILYF